MLSFMYAFKLSSGPFTLASLGLALAALSACGSDIHISNSAGSGGQAAGSSGSAGSGTSIPVDPVDPPPTEPLPFDVAGHYMQMSIGNCINAEDWLSFSAPPQFTHTLVDRDYCGEHSVSAHPGSFSALPGHILETEWKSDTEGMMHSFTLHVFEPYPYVPPQPMPDGYNAGTKALNTMAYVRTDDTLTYRRTEHKRWISGADDFRQSLLIELSFGAPFESVTAPTPCTMKVRISASVDGTLTKPETGEEFFGFACTYGPVPDSPWIQVSADGFGDNIYGGQWMDLLTDMGVWDKYSSPLSSLFYEQFYPLFYIAPDDSNVLIDNRGTAWYQQMLHAPPDSVQ